MYEKSQKEAEKEHKHFDIYSNTCDYSCIKLAYWWRRRRSNMMSSPIGGGG
jgi:hypothetical protein